MLKNVISAVAAMGLVMAPVAAQAGTRAGDSNVSLENAAREASPIADFLGLGNDRDAGRCDGEGALTAILEELLCEESGGEWITGKKIGGWLLLGGGFLVAVAALAQVAENDASQGTGG